jgi:hypothetical protein
MNDRLHENSSFYFAAIAEALAAVFACSLRERSMTFMAPRPNLYRAAMIRRRARKN